MTPSETRVVQRFDPTPCPVCGAAGEGRFCEGCGHELAAEPARLASEPVEWEIEIAADRRHFERFSQHGADFPDTAKAQTVRLDGDEISVGRAGDGEVAVDLGRLSGDRSVSRLHVMLVRQDDGSYAVVDRGSTNGTTLNDAPEPIPVGEAVPLRDGDCLHVGSWTALTLRRRDGGVR